MMTSFFSYFDLHLPAHVAAFSTDAKMCLIIGAIFCLYWYFITYNKSLKNVKTLHNRLIAVC